MNPITQEILSEKMRMNPDPLYIRKLQRLQDKGEITQQDFINTGRVVTLDFFKKRVYPFTLNNLCTDVILYVGDFYIQMLMDGDFLLEVDNIKVQSKDIELVEDVLWIQYAKNKFN